MSWDDPPLGIACRTCGVDALRLDERQDPEPRTWTVCFACGATFKGNPCDYRNPLDGIPCRECGVTALRIEWRLTAEPLGSHPLAGSSPKLSAYEHPWAVCDACGAEGKGKK